MGRTVRKGQGRQREEPQLFAGKAGGKLRTGRHMVFDDGTVWRIGENRFLLTSSTGGADRMATHISYVRQYL